ncbi:hypothetical protein ACVWXQ_002095 [Bradyrhizobium sp. S3.14.4]
MSRSNCCLVHQPVGGFANGFQPAQAVGERGRHLFCARAFRTRRLRQQQARLQEGKPGRHHEIIGSKLQPDLSRGFDEVEVLVGQRQDRDLGEIDLLLPRQREQQVERALIALDVHHQRRLTLGELCRPPGFKR